MSKSFYNKEENYWSNSINLGESFKTQKECNDIINTILKTDPYTWRFKKNPIVIINRTEAIKLFRDDK